MKKIGRVWKFGSDINTDLMLPGPLLYATEEVQKRAVFAATRPGWVDAVTPGDIMIAGTNFGFGSSRPAARSLRNLGIGCLLAESLNGLYFRSSVNFGFMSLECPGIHAAFEEDQTAEVDVENWTVRNRETGTVLNIPPIPERLFTLMQNGGLYPWLEQQGLIAPRPAAAAATAKAN